LRKEKEEYIMTNKIKMDTYKKLGDKFYDTLKDVYYTTNKSTKYRAEVNSALNIAIGRMLWDLPEDAAQAILADLEFLIGQAMKDELRGVDE